eukprot:1727353-Rhodomonas_salina.1
MRCQNRTWRSVRMARGGRSGNLDDGEDDPERGKREGEFQKVLRPQVDEVAHAEQVEREHVQQRELAVHDRDRKPTHKAANCAHEWHGHDGVVAIALHPSPCQDSTHEEAKTGGAPGPDRAELSHPLVQKDPDDRLAVDRDGLAGLWGPDDIIVGSQLSTRGPDQLPLAAAAMRLQAERHRVQLCRRVRGRHHVESAARHTASSESRTRRWR